MFPSFLTNGHILLRPPRIEDAEAIARAVHESPPELCRYIPWCFSPPSAKGYMESVTFGHSCVFCFGLEVNRTLSAWYFLISIAINIGRLLPNVAGSLLKFSSFHLP